MSERDDFPSEHPDGYSTGKAETKSFTLAEISKEELLEELRKRNDLERLEVAYQDRALGVFIALNKFREQFMTSEQADRLRGKIEALIRSYTINA